MSSLRSSALREIGADRAQACRRTHPRVPRAAKMLGIAVHARREAGAVSNPAAAVVKQRTVAAIECAAHSVAPPSWSYQDAAYRLVVGDDEDRDRADAGGDRMRAQQRDVRAAEGRVSKLQCECARERLLGRPEVRGEVLRRESGRRPVALPPARLHRTCHEDSRVRHLLSAARSRPVPSAAAEAVQAPLIEASRHARCDRTARLQACDYEKLVAPGVLAGRSA